LESENLTRRQLAILATAALAAVKASAQAPAQTPPPTADYYQAALESHKRNSATLAQFPVAMSVEPAFQFKA
jgi:hypothetical protein